MDRPIRDELLREFGQRVAERRKALGLSQAELAELLGLANAESISRYERGAQDPRLSTVVRLAEVLEAAPAGLVPSPLGAGEDGAVQLSHMAGALVEEIAARSVPALELAVGALSGMLDTVCSTEKGAPTEGGEDEVTESASQQPSNGSS